MMTDAQIRDSNNLTDRQKVQSVLVNHDAKAAKRRGYNPYALGHYMAAMDSALACDDRREGVLSYFCGPLADKVLAVLGLPVRGPDEQHR